MADTVGLYADWSLVTRFSSHTKLVRAVGARQMSIKQLGPFTSPDGYLQAVVARSSNN